jgi:hypothetical protein
MADEPLNDMSEEQIRRILRNCEHSVAWCIEDVAVKLLVAASPQVLYRENWLARMNAIVGHTRNAMDVAGAAELSAAHSIEALRAYPIAVGQRAGESVPLPLEPRPSHLPWASWIATEYWETSNADEAGFLCLSWESGQ